MKSLVEFINEATYYEYGSKEWYRHKGKYGPSEYREGMKTINIPTGNKLRPTADVEIGCCKLNGFVMAKFKNVNFDYSLEGEWYEVSWMNKENTKNIIAFVTPSSPWIFFYERYLKSMKYVGPSEIEGYEDYEDINDPNTFDEKEEHTTNWRWTDIKAVYAEDFTYDDPKNLYKILSKEFDGILKNGEIIEDFDKINIIHR